MSTTVVILLLFSSYCSS